MDHAIISGCMTSIRPKDIISGRIKADELFLTWLAQKETKDFIQDLIGSKPKDDPKDSKRKTIQKNKSKNSDRESKKVLASPRKSTPIDSQRVRQLRNSRDRTNEEVDKEVSMIKSLFANYDSDQITFDQLIASILEALEMPKFLFPSFVKKLVGQIPKEERINYSDFLDIWTSDLSKSDRTTRFFWCLKSISKNFIAPDDWIQPLRYLLDTHPGLEFLKGSPEYQERYIETVIARIFFGISRSCRHKLTLSDIKASDLINSVYQLHNQEDITHSPQYFDYMSHFVIYSRFIEIDVDKDFYITKEELASYNNYALSGKVIDRAFYLIRFKKGSTRKYSYQDFVWFMIAEEDKSYLPSINVWFRCLDYDEDGYWSPEDLYHFYEEQLFRMEYTVLDVISFEDSLSQILDMIKPRDPSKITLSEVIKSGYATEIFNLMFNLSKLRIDERKYPLSLFYDAGDVDNWQKFATIQYELALGETSFFYESDDNDVIDYWGSIESDDNSMASGIGTPRTD